MIYGLCAVSRKMKRENDKLLIRELQADLLQKRVILSNPNGIDLLVSKYEHVSGS